ncbi:MAG: DUF6473 family protein [Paracoccaceae bacterium]
MSFEYQGEGALDYFPCHYGRSKLLFRGPKRSISGDYNVAIGGSETFGKFVEVPYPSILEIMTGKKIINLGCMYSGPNVFLNEPSVLEICQNAKVTIIQLTGAQNMSNRFYTVHPRRNDRFLGPTHLMKSVFPDVDLTDVHFTGHLLRVLREKSVRRFDLVRQELQLEWVRQMQVLLGKIGGQIVLLWLAGRGPNDLNNIFGSRADPLFLKREMIEELTERHVRLVEVIASPEEVAAGHERMIYNQLQESAAQQMLGPIAHQEASRRLVAHFG